MDQFLLDYPNLILHAQPDPQVQVRDLSEPGAVQAAGLETTFANQCARMAERVGLEEEEIQPGMACAVGLVKDPVEEVGGIFKRMAMLIDHFCMGKDRAEFRTVIEECHLLGQLILGPDIV